MFRKLVRLIFLALVLLYGLFVSVILIVRLPSYTISTTGKLYIVNKKSRDIQVFDLYTGKEIAEIPIDMQSHEVITTKNQRNVLITDFGNSKSQGNRIKVIDIKTNEIEKNIDLDEKFHVNGIVDFPAPNKIGLIDYVNNELLIVNSATDSLETRIPTGQKNSHLMALHPKKPLAFITNMKSNSVSVIDLDLNEVIKVIPCGRTTESIAITPDGSEVWVTNKNGNSVSIIDTATYKVISTVSTGDEPLKIKFSIDGKYTLVANANDGSISIYDRYTRKHLKTIQIPGKHKLVEKILYHTPRPVNILMHPNGLYAFVANSNASKVEVIDMRTFEIVSTIGTGKIPDALAFVE